MCRTTLIFFYIITLAMSSVPAFGRGKCGKCHTRYAYYFSSDKKEGVCGYHAPPKPERQKLPRDVAAEEKDRTDHTISIIDAQMKNKAKGQKGTVLCQKMHMLARFQCKEGFLNVFPNFRHGGRKDGLGLPSLSPKSIGPIHHNQPGLPPALNLENFHQGSKWFPGVSRAAFEANRLHMYMDPVPHRHSPHSKNKNIPECFVWVDEVGEHKLTYLESRQFYCFYYAEAVWKSKDFQNLRTRVDSGTNIIIHGYDGYQPTEDINAHYEDTSRPFGHEVVLYTMLVHPREEWPWLSPKHNTFAK